LAGTRPRSWRRVAAAGRDLDFLRLPVQEFSACPADSIDYAVMEKTDAAVVVPLVRGLERRGLLGGACAA
jgi:mannose-1-phosphate guanylyltransferase